MKRSNGEGRKRYENAPCYNYLTSLRWLCENETNVLKIGKTDNLLYISGTPKYIANKIKSKGLQKLRWFCQMCEKQCRDEVIIEEYLHIAKNSPDHNDFLLDVLKANTYVEGHMQSNFVLVNSYQKLTA